MIARFYTPGEVRWQVLIKRTNIIPLALFNAVLTERKMGWSTRFIRGAKGSTNSVDTEFSTRLLLL